jgi:pimeloyl-ACP methyl ester carboxylesterase
VSAMAADLADLRRVLGLDLDDGLGSEGTASRVSFEYVRTHPDVRLVVADSPWFPDVDDLTGGVIGTREALANLFETCASDPACDHAYPNLEETWHGALDRLADTPIHTTYQPAGSEPVDVVVDAAKLLRVARFALGGDGPDNLAQLPATIAAAAEGTATDWLAETLARDPMLCVGYRPFCAGQEAFGFGVYLTAFCAEQVPFIDFDALDELIGDDPVYRTVFADSPYVEACDAWDVPAADPAIANAVDTDVPVLLMSGEFDSFSPPSISHDQAARLSAGWALTIPAMTHNVLGFSPCAVDLRDRWRDDPDQPPDDHACDAATPVRFEAPD